MATPNNHQPLGGTATPVTAIARPRIVHHPSPVLYGTGGSGLARTFQQALTVAVEQSRVAAQQHQPTPRGSIPPLHRREGHGNAAAASSSSAFLQPDAAAAAAALGDPDATEFLSRILLLLGSFVILCLLLF
jgi:hypothetical protein